MAFPNALPIGEAETYDKAERIIRLIGALPTDGGRRVCMRVRMACFHSGQEAALKELQQVAELVKRVIQ